jgi:hypothetical protein
MLNREEIFEAMRLNRMQSLISRGASFNPPRTAVKGGVRPNVLSGSSGGGEPPSYSTEAQEVFDLMVDELTTQQKNAIAKFIDHQVAVSNWDATKTKVNRFFCLGGLSAANALVDWTGRENASLISTPAWNSATGFTTTNTALINTNFVPATDMVAGGQNDQHYGVWAKNITTNATGSFFGARGATTTHWIFLRQNFTTEDLDARCHSNTSNSATYFRNVITSNAKTDYCAGVSRTSSSAQRIRMNGQIIATDAANTSTGRPATHPIYIGGENQTGVIGSVLNADYVCWWSSVDLTLNHEEWALGIEQLMYDLGCTTKRIMPGTFETKDIDANDYFIAILLGQSNQEGAIDDTSYPAGDQVEFDCDIWYRTGLATSASWMKYQAGVSSNSNIPNVSVDHGGPELVFAKKAAEKYPGQVGIIKMGVSGSALRPDGAVDDWDPDNVGELFDDATNLFIDSALSDSFLTGKNVRILMIDWMQGETDAGDSAPGTYDADLDYFMRKLVERLESHGYDLSETHFTIGRLQDKLIDSVTPRPSLANVRTAQETNGSETFFSNNPTFAGRLAASYWYDRDDIQIKASDNTHEELAGQRYRGLRMFRYFNDLI